MKQMTTLFTISLLVGTACLFSSFRGDEKKSMKINSVDQTKVKLYKENTESEWKEVNGVEISNHNAVVLHLDYDTYYTVQISDLKDLSILNHFSTALPSTTSKLFSLDLNEKLLLQNTGLENYFTECAFGLMSYTKNDDGYCILIKTNSKELITK